ncbi:CBO0543 family protein [Cohnella candidum]|uniref:Uncharacterized protein n=1 Tax=Cohnella candidum TaxID=2674991 RepID=A0A3G3K3J7_9BACL|nr:CBO0543 family protein [Cohnella candidum]AYQ75022.1 hypothetical protein EAV92_22165 [Cohnella candidum]
MFLNEKFIDITDENTRKTVDLVLQKIDIWREYVLYSWQWWFGLFLTIAPWILWMLFKRKAGTDRSLYVALYAIVISVTLDICGAQIGLWHYRYEVVPTLPSYFPWDFTLMPVSILALRLVKPQASRYAKAAFFAIVTSFVGEPFFRWIDVYSMDHWHYAYSVPIQFLIYLFCDSMGRRSGFGADTTSPGAS